MTEESKRKLEWLVENVCDVTGIYILNNIDDVNTRPWIKVRFKDPNSPTMGKSLWVTTDFMTDEFGRFNTVPSIIFTWFYNGTDEDNEKKDFTIVYEDGRWFV